MSVFYECEDGQTNIFHSGVLPMLEESSAAEKEKVLFQKDVSAHTQNQHESTIKLSIRKVAQASS